MEKAIYDRGGLYAGKLLRVNEAAHVYRNRLKTKDLQIKLGMVDSDIGLGKHVVFQSEEHFVRVKVAFMIEQRSLVSSVENFLMSFTERCVDVVGW